MSLVIDIALLVLLVGTLAYAFIVERRVRVMMQALRELEPLVGEFSAAVDRSESTVSVLKSLGQSVQAPFARREAEAPTAPTQQTARSAPRSSTGIPMKSDLVRGFFETVRSREA